MGIVSDEDSTSVLPKSRKRLASGGKFKPAVSANQVANSLPLSLLAFFSAIKYLTLFVVIIFMTINRVTYPRAFFIYLTGNLFYDDVIIIALGSLACLTLFYKNKRIFVYSLALILAPLGVSMAINNLIPLDIAALVIFPGIVGSYVAFKKKVDLGKRITRNSLIMTGAGILFVIEFLSLMTWIVYPSYGPFWGKIFSPSPEWYLASVEAQLFYAAARLAPAIALVLAFSFFIRPGFESLVHLFTGKSFNATEHSETAPDNNDALGGAGETKSGPLAANPNYLPSEGGNSFETAGSKAIEKQEIIAAPREVTEPPFSARRQKRLHPNLRARNKLAGKGPRRRFENELSSNRKNRSSIFVPAKLTPRSAKRFWLFVSISLVILFSLYPYLASINRDFSTVSVDSTYYVNQIDNIKNNGVFSKDGPFSFSSERALSVLFFYGIAAVMPSVPTDVVVAYLPIFLGSFLVFSSYLLIRYGANTKENGEASHFVVPLLVPFSMQFIVGIYGGFFSNMLALSFMLLTLLFYLRFLRSSKMLDLGLFVAMMFMTLFGHVYTWVFLIATLVVSTVILAVAKRKTEKKKPHILMLLSIAISVAVLLSVSSLVTGKSGLDYINGVVNTNTGQNFLETRWFNINTTFRFYLGGFLANSVLLGLAMIWAFKANYKNHFNAVMLASIFIFSAFFFLGDEVTQSRIFFNIPLFIPAAIVLTNFMTGKYLTSIDSRTRTTIVVLIFLYLGNYALRSLANFYLIAPPPI